MFDDKDIAIVCLTSIAVVGICAIMFYGNIDYLDKFIVILSTIIGAISGIATGKMSKNDK